MKLIAYPLLLALLLINSEHCRASEEKVSVIYASHPGVPEREWQLSLPAECRPVVYASFTAAIDIVSIVADGKPIERIRRYPVENAHFAVSTVGSATMVYGCMCDYVSSTEDVKQKQLVEDWYSIPLTAHRVQVDYRVRFPDGSTSELYRLFSFDDFDRRFSGGLLH
jgi:hypothetical protein